MNELYCWDGEEYGNEKSQPDGWQQYSERYVQCSQEEYLQRVGGADAIAKLPLPVF